jgi:hypothetical protein
MRSSQDTAITILDKYDTYAGDKSDAGVGLGLLGPFYIHIDFASPYRPETCSK